MKKIFVSFFFSLSILICFVSCAFAVDGFGGTDRGGTFGSGGFGSGSISTVLSYDALSDLCASVNSALYNGVYDSAGFNGCSASIEARSDGYYIGIYKSGTWYWLRNESGGAYISPYNSDAALYTNYEGTVYSVADMSKHIFNRLNTVSNTISGYLSTNLDGTVYSVADMMKHVYNRLGTYGDKLSCTYTENGVTYTYTIAEWGKHIYNRLGTLNSTLGSIDSHLTSYLRSYYPTDDATYTVAEWTKHIFNRLGTLNTTMSNLSFSGATVNAIFDDSNIVAELQTIQDKIDDLELSLTVNNAVVTQVENSTQDVDTGLTYLSRILSLVKPFFANSQTLNWTAAGSYVSGWGVD